MKEKSEKSFPTSQFIINEFRKRYKQGILM